MAIQAKKQSSWFVILIIAAAVILWVLDQRKAYEEKSSRPPRRESSSGSDQTWPKPKSPTASPTPKSSINRGVEKQGSYEVYRNCTLASDRSNDGDSFRVTLPNGKQEVFRLYFVDTPESEFRTYRNGDTNHERIRDQASYFGVSPERAVEIGQEGKHMTLDLLAKRPFTLYTLWDSPFHDERYHAFIQVNDGGKPHWLHEILITKGLARLKTKPADLPDGTSASEHRRHLEAMQRSATLAKLGGWKN